MKKRLFLFKSSVILSAFFFSACSMSYAEIRIRKFTAVDAAGNILDINVYNKINENQKLYIFTHKRYLPFTRKPGFENDLNKKSVFLIKDGKLNEASAFLSQLISSAEKFPEVYNNLAVINELNGNRTIALQFYSKACMLMPSDEKIIHNFRQAGE